MKLQVIYEVPILWIEVLFFPGTFRRQRGGILKSKVAMLSIVMASFVAAIFDTIWYSLMSVQTRFDVLLSFVLYVGKNIVTVICLWLVVSLFLNALSVLFLLTAFTTREGAIIFTNLIFFFWLGLITTQAIEIQYRLRRISALISVFLSFALIWFFYFLLFDIIYLSPWLPYY
jgi:hypothetical protein